MKVGGSLSRGLRYFASLSKLPQTLMLVFTAFIGYVTPHGHLNPAALSILLVSEFLAISGTTSINMYHDRDIDALMGRTKSRPLPSGSIRPREALALGYVLLFSGLAISVLDGLLLTLTIILGYAFDIWVYTVMLKRRSSLNIIFGGIAGAMPILGGWVARTGSFGVGGVVLSLLILLWIPLHTWVITLVHKEDYTRAGIPMVPLRAGVGRLFVYLFFALAAFFFATFELAVIGLTTWLMPTLSGVMIAALLSMLYAAFFLGRGRLLRPSQMLADVFLMVSLLSLLLR